MVITIRPFLTGDVRAIRGREYEQEMIKLTGRDFGEQFATQGPAFTMLSDGEPVIAAGVYLLWPGVGEAWMHLSPWFYGHVKTAVREVREILSAIIVRHGLRRVQAPICAQMPANKRFVEHLGFAPEGLMHRWGPEDGDYWLYAIVAPEGESLCQLRP
jgi:hypothetical protein